MFLAFNTKHSILIWFETIDSIGYLGGLGQVEHGVTGGENEDNVDQVRKSFVKNSAGIKLSLNRKCRMHLAFKFLYLDSPVTSLLTVRKSGMTSWLVGTAV